MKKIFLILVFSAVLLPLSAAAAQKIAVVDMEKVFREYYKSRIAEESIRQQAEVYRAYLLKLKDELRKLEDEYAVARDESQNIALSEDQRRKASDTARRKTEEIAAKRAEAEKYAVEKNNQMKDMELAKRQAIIEDIKNEIKRRAALEGYDIVLDTSGRTANDFPAVIYHNPAIDLTAELIKSLNATATAAPAKDKQE